MTQDQTPVAYVCACCTERYSTDGICKDCNEALVPIYTLDCPECGEELKADAKHCSHCGASVQKKCPNCGTILDASDRFCADCGKENTDSQAAGAKAKERSAEFDHITGQELIDLMYEPVGLNEFRKNYPYMYSGPQSEGYNTAVERAFTLTDEKRITMRLAAAPRMWGILKPGMMRRLMNIGIDVVLYCGIFFATLVVLIGSHKSGGILRPFGLAGKDIRGFVAMAWFVFTYVSYTAVAEAKLGSTLGGFIVGTAVVDGYGRKMPLGETLTRQITKFLYPLNFLLGPGDDDYEVVIK